MPGAQRSAVARHRARRERQGIVRLEVQVQRPDVALVRGLAAALADPKRASATRRFMRERLAPSGVDLKALLAAAPLEGIVLDRDDDPGRAVEL